MSEGAVYISQKYITFPCPLCSSLLCTRRSNNKAVNVNKHFHSQHPEHDPKSICFSCCIVKNPSQKHRVQCALDKRNAMKTVERITVTPSVNNVVAKRNPYQIHTRIQRMVEFYEKEKVNPRILANRLPDNLSHLRNDPDLPVVERYSLDVFFSKVLPVYDYSSFMRPLTYRLDEPHFRNYLSNRFKTADPSTAMGKAIRQLLSFDPDSYYHLIICHHLLASFADMYSRHPDLFEITPFSCYCNTKKDLDETHPDEVLHLHFLVRIPDFKEFEKQVWNKLVSRTGKRNKKSTKIKTLFHYCSVILYISQQRFDKGDLTKHFLIRTFLEPAEELSLLLVFPFLGIEKIIHYSNLNILRHFDLYKLKNKNYGSKLVDLFNQIGLYKLPMDGTSFDFRTKKEITFFACFGEMLIFSFGVENTYYIWTKQAKSHCQALFTRKVIKEQNDTKTFDLSISQLEDGKYEFMLSSYELTLRYIDMDNLLCILRAEAEWKNICIRGTRLDVETFKAFASGFDTGRLDAFKIIHNNYEFFIFFIYTILNVENHEQILEERNSNINLVNNASIEDEWNDEDIIEESDNF